MIKVLYVIAGDMSFDEMLFVDAFINQLPAGTVRNHLLVPALPLSHVALQNRSVEFTVAKPGFGYEDFEKVMQEFDPQMMILVDPYILLGPDGPDLSYIELDWLEGLNCHIAVMDFRANLLKTPDDLLALDAYVLAGETPPYALDYDYLIKICPPHDAVPSQNPKLLQWGCQDLMSALTIHSVREDVRTQLGCVEGSRLVSLVFPVENTLLAMQKGIAAHFPVVIETLIHYLNQLDGHYVLAVINMPPPFEDYDFDNVQIRFFPTLDMELLGNLLKATELFITESLSYPGLALSALRDIPTISLASGASLGPDGTITARAELSPLLQMKLEALKEDAPEAIFPFISFPSHFRRPWPQTELYMERFLYFLVDLFNEPRTLQILDSLLSQRGPDYDFFRESLADYRKRKLALTLDAEQIVRKLVTAPPRHLV